MIKYPCSLVHDVHPYLYDDVYADLDDEPNMINQLADLIVQNDDVVDDHIYTFEFIGHNGGTVSYALRRGDSWYLTDIEADFEYDAMIRELTDTFDDPLELLRFLEL